MSLVTRFAPSPTGDLHIGGVRTALFAWLLAKKAGGTFILRIEDTDLERSTESSTAIILEGMAWLELNHDSGPFFQSQHTARYKTVIHQLLTNGHAYRCTCSKERLETLRKQQEANKEKPRYDGHCRALNIGEAAPFVVRFKNPQDGAVTFDDLVHGPITFQNSELDDLIIARSDGSPTYNLTVVVDDWDMHITHVIRGDDHINNTPRQINILKALGSQLPQYGHVPMILGPDGKRLSKRHGAVSVLQYREEGFLREALLNFLVRLGWSHGDQEIFSLEEMIASFDTRHIGKSPAAFNPEKLLWLNQHYQKTLPPERVADDLAYQFKLLGINTSHGPRLTDIVTAQCERAKTLREMAEKSRYFYESPTLNPQAVQKHLTDEARAHVAAFTERLSHLTDWETHGLHECLQAYVTEHNLKLGQLAQPVRVLLTGDTTSPPIDVTLHLLGKATSLSRLKHDNRSDNPRVVTTRGTHD